MKTLITILLLTGTAKAQSNTTRIAELEKFRTWTKAEIAWLRKGKTTDSIRINILRDSLSKFKPIIFPDAIVRYGIKVDTVYVGARLDTVYIKPQ